jgi:general L-amino acid transport system substrate-binding protein
VGTEGDLGEQVGLTHHWAAHIIALVGNYSEVFERNMGVGSKLGIARGLNNLWSNGGLRSLARLATRGARGLLKSKLRMRL